ncbi:MAG: hypothetical protein ACI80N_002368, partial [Gammaproteobacteria bacterium]
VVLVEPCSAALQGRLRCLDFALHAATKMASSRYGTFSTGCWGATALVPDDFSTASWRGSAISRQGSPALASTKSARPVIRAERITGQAV